MFQSREHTYFTIQVEETGLPFTQLSIAISPFIIPLAGIIQSAETSSMPTVVLLSLGFGVEIILRGSYSKIAGAFI